MDVRTNLGDHRRLDGGSTPHALNELALLPPYTGLRRFRGACFRSSNHHAGEPLVKWLETWQAWALLSAAFAAGTAIFAKIGVENINSDFATFIRTIVILCVLGAILIATGRGRELGSISARTYVFLVLSGLATGGSWICYFRALKIGDAARVAPIDKLSVVLVAIFGATFLGERLSSLNWLGVALIAAGAILVAVKI
jgi:transporter family protein